MERKDEEKKFLIIKYMCPYCGIIKVSKKEIKQCSSCHRKMISKKPVIIKQVFI
jgi:rubrerythrin